MENSTSGADTIKLLVDLYRFLLRKWLTLLAAGIICGLIGLLYATFQKPLYIAEITFAPENDSKGSLGAYAGIAAQFGVDIGVGSTGGAFEGENLMEFLKSHLMIESALLTKVNIQDKPELLVNYYIRLKKLDKGWDKEKQLKNFSFTSNYVPGVRERDSVLKKISDNIAKNLDIQKKDKKLNIVSAKVTDGDELFAKLFIETLVDNGIDYYVNYRSGKSKENVEILQRQTDSVYRMMTGGITSAAISSDLNVNPLKQISRAGNQRRQVDIQVNSKVYEELVKQLELSKIALRRETPFIQIIDTPILPLEKKKLGRLVAIIAFGFVGGVLSFLALTLQFFGRRYLSSISFTNETSK